MITDDGGERPLSSGARAAARTLGSVARDELPTAPLAAIPARSRGDGLLNHDLLPGDKAAQDACGVFGVWAAGEQVAKLTYFGLYALQHRGQESDAFGLSYGSSKNHGLVDP